MRNNTWTKPVYPLEGVRSVNYGSVKLSIASDIISLLRILFELPVWKDVLSQFVVSTLASLPNLLADFSKNKTISDKTWLQRMHTIIAIFSVFGGNQDLVYPGSMVQAKSASEEPQVGIVIKSEPLLGVATFVTTNRLGATIRENVPFDLLIPTPDIKYVLSSLVNQLFTCYRFNPSSFALTPSILANLQPLFTGASKNDDEDVVRLKFDDDNEPDLELCEALRSRCVVSEVRRCALKALGELLQFAPSVAAFSESVLVNRLGELSLKASFTHPDLESSHAYYAETAEKLLDVSKYNWLRVSNSYYQI